MRSFWLLVVLVGLPAAANEANLLKGRVPTQAMGVEEAGRMTDGLAAPDGDIWRSTRTSVILLNGYAVWDLGEVKPIRAAMLQGDNNDDYLLEASTDGTTWAPLWRVHTIGIPGMQTRQIRDLQAAGRFIRLTARGGDNSYSVSELELHSAPETMKDMKRQRGRASDEVPALLWLGTLGAIAFLVQSKQKILWLAGAPLLSALLWASLTALLDRFVV